MKKHITICCLMFLIALTAVSQEQYSDSQELYREKYRPQYHYTPANRWIGDPCGLIKFNGKYMAYCWGAAESTDLVHWKELNNHAITNMPKGIAAFTGSVVIDRKNTAGYGENTPIAAFTSFDEASKKQSQSIAFSLDQGLTFKYYDLNPVLDIWSTEFRDPTVIRDERNDRWVMAVAKALEKKVAFYHSADLKHWTWMSDFGPMGDQERSWECPDLFQVCVDGNPNAKKWVLVVSVNWAREQYFVGDFDGSRFVPDHPDAAPLYLDEGLDYYASRVFQNYDDAPDKVYTIGWVNTWDYANPAPTTYGKGIWSLPREYSLRSTPQGLRLYQMPCEALKSLRGAPYTFSRRLKPGICPLPAVSKMDNTYELQAEIHVNGNDVAGFHLCEADGRKVAVSYDTASGTLLIDRTHSTDAEIEKFSRVAHHKVKPVDGVVTLNIFVDKSTIEIFVNHGESVCSLLTFAAPEQTNAIIFSLTGKTKVNLTAWPMKSIWFE